MSTAQASPVLIRFGIFEADLRAGELRRSGVKVRIQDLPFRALAVLLSRPQEVVSREELRQELWPDDVFVDFNRGISSAVKRLRDALGDSADNPIFIETVDRHGYRWIGPASTVEPAPAPASDSHAASAAPAVESESPLQVLSSPQRWILPPRWLTAAVIVALAGALSFFSVRWKTTSFRPGSVSSLAVLPLENLSGDPAQDYLADGLTDELTTDLARISSLRVVSRTSAQHYRNTAKALPAIANELDVDAVVEGSVKKVRRRRLCQHPAHRRPQRPSPLGRCAAQKTWQRILYAG